MIGHKEIELSHVRKAQMGYQVPPHGTFGDGYSLEQALQENDPKPVRVQGVYGWCS